MSGMIITLQNSNKCHYFHKVDLLFYYESLLQKIRVQRFEYSRILMHFDKHEFYKRNHEHEN